MKSGGVGPYAAIQIIHGPPGTGKTSTLVTLLDTIMLDRDHGRMRVWVAAPTNHIGGQARADFVHTMQTMQTFQTLQDHRK